MSDADILRCVEMLDERYPRGRNLKGTEPLFASIDAKTERSNAHLRGQRPSLESALLIVK
ncbi:MAG: hypothetical protein DRG83_13710 [Deltaproteobacteria bacterium]|nr:MAG: hypothetical protein DRG83_13710 [Deltaproteobacteria bacterium]